MRISELVFFALMLLFGFYMITRARKGKMPFLRKLPAIDALEMAVGRATEMGRPVIFSPGISTESQDALIGYEGAQNLAGLAVLGHVARLTARYKTPLVVAVKNPEIMPIADAICMLSYRAEGKPEMYNRDMVQYIGGDQYAFAVGIVDLMHDIRSGANILIGPWYGETLIIISGGAEVGAMQVGGSARTYAAPFFVAAMDYSLMGEELFAAGAYISKEPVQTGTIAGQDLAKILTVGMILIGVILATAGLAKLFSTYLNMTI